MYRADLVQRRNDTTEPGQTDTACTGDASMPFAIAEWLASYDPREDAVLRHVSDRAPRARRAPGGTVLHVDDSRAARTHPRGADVRVSVCVGRIGGIGKASRARGCRSRVEPAAAFRTLARLCPRPPRAAARYRCGMLAASGNGPSRWRNHGAPSSSALTARNGDQRRAARRWRTYAH